MFGTSSKEFLVEVLDNGGPCESGDSAMASWPASEIDQAMIT